MSTDPMTVEWYNQNAAKYAGHINDPKNSPRHSYYEKPAIYKLLPELNGLNVLSLGCASGEDSAHLKELGASRSVGLDISEELIKIAQSNHSNCEFFVGSMEELPFKDGEFDLVYSSFAFHYLETYSKVLSESYRVLKQGGTLVFSVGHPLETAEERIIEGTATIKRLGFLRDKSKNQIEVYGDYLGHRKLKSNDPDFDVVSWQQPLSKTINEIAQAGFIIEQCVEPLPLQEYEEVDRYNYEVLKKIPGVVIFRARKG